MKEEVRDQNLDDLFDLENPEFLYSDGINPIKSNGRIKIWGQKTVVCSEDKLSKDRAVKELLDLIENKIVKEIS